MGDFARMVENCHQIESKGATVRNPQANSTLERIDQALRKTSRTFESHKEDFKTLENAATWEEILAAAMFASRSMHHTTSQAVPSQLVFQRDAMSNVPFAPDWSKIKENKQKNQFFY